MCVLHIIANESAYPIDFSRSLCHIRGPAPKSVKGHGPVGPMDPPMHVSLEK